MLNGQRIYFTDTITGTGYGSISVFSDLNLYLIILLPGIIISLIILIG